MPKTYRPRTKTRTVQDEFPEAFLLAFNIDNFARRYGTTDEELAKAMMKSTDTLRRRRERPWEYTVVEITMIARLWGMTPGQLMVEPRYIVDAAEIL